MYIFKTNIMGDIADMMLEGILDEQTGEYLGKAVGYPRTLQKRHYNTQKLHITLSMKKIKAIRKEIAVMIKEQSINIEEARRLTNLKYGKGWRERGLCVNSDDQWSEEDLKDFQ